jgi:N-acetyl-D-muramate 6-phosphate phosphatase
MLDIRALAFDLDGTLADTARDLIDVAQIVCREAGFLAVSNSTLRAQISVGARAMLASAFDSERDDPKVVQAARRLEKYYAARPAKLTCLFPGVHEAIEEAYALGMPWCVVTNKLAPLTRLVMHGLSPLPPGYCGIVAGGSTAHSKPHAQPLHLASRLMGVREKHIVMIGDDLRDITCARAAGAHSAAACWGYIHENDDPAQWGADVVLDDARQLPSLWRSCA